MRYKPILHIVLHQPEIPQNTGNIGRTCAAIGAKLWLVRPLGFRIDERQLRRAGMDYWQQLEWEAVDDWETLCQRLPGIPYWFLTKKATRSLHDVAFHRADVLVFGSESQGLPADLLANHPEQTVRIPMRESIRSLNLSSSVAAASYEAVRQIHLLPGE